MISKSVQMIGAAVVLAVATATASLAADDEALMTAGPLGDMSLGSPDAPNTVIEYASLTCSHCAAFHAETYDAFKEKYIDTGEVHFILRLFPLNPLDTAAMMLARCAPEERFFPIVDLLLERQRTWAFTDDPISELRKLVKQAGISDDGFKACLTNQEILDGVNWVNAHGAELGVGSTPTFFFNGEKSVGVLSIEEIDEILGG